MIKKFLIILMLSLVSFSFVNISKAGINDAFGGTVQGGTGDVAESALTTAAGEMGYDTDKNDINPIIEVIIRIALSFLGVIFIITLIYGGYLWMTSHGNDQQFEKSKNLIKAAIIGLFIVAAAYAISWYVIGVMSQNALSN